MSSTKKIDFSDIVHFVFIALGLILYVCLPIFYYPITQIHCSKSENYCTIKQNFITNSVHKLYDDDTLLISLQYSQKIFRKGVNIDYKLITSENKNYYSYYKRYTYDKNPLAASKFRKDFSKYLNTKNQDLFDKLHIPCYYIILISLLLLLLITRKKLFKNIFIIYILTAPLGLDAIFYIWNVFF